MAKRRQTPNRPRDVNELAKRVVGIASGEEPDVVPEAVLPSRAKRGEARAAKLSPEQRKRIASKAARARWDKKG